MAERIIYRARYESRNFTFEAYGETPEEANTGLEAALAAHARRYGTDPQWLADVFTELNEVTDLRRLMNDPIWPAFKLGAPYRDGEEIAT